MTDEEIAKLKHLREVLDAAPVPSNGLVEMTEIASLGAHRALKSADNRQWTPVECLQDAINDIVTGKSPADKLLILRIDTREEKFNVGYHACNVKASEILAACECIKAQVLQEMGYVE